MAFQDVPTTRRRMTAEDVLGVFRDLCLALVDPDGGRDDAQGQ